MDFFNHKSSKILFDPPFIINCYNREFYASIKLFAFKNILNTSLLDINSTNYRVLLLYLNLAVTCQGFDLPAVQNFASSPQSQTAWSYHEEAQFSCQPGYKPTLELTSNNQANIIRVTYGPKVNMAHQEGTNMYK